jgi:dTMP kinase
MDKKQIDGGLLIIFDGIDGVGKTTQLNKAYEALDQSSWLLYKSRNLGGSEIGEKLRDVMLSPVSRPALSDLYIGAAIQEALLSNTNDQRAKGAIVLHDRGPLSLTAYQCYGNEAPKNLGERLTDYGMKNLKPDLYIVYKANTETSLNRARAVSKKADYFEKNPLDFFKRVENGFRVLSETYDLSVIDADRSIEEIHEDTMKLINQLIDARTVS